MFCHCHRVDGLHGLNPRKVRLRHRPAAAQAGFPGGITGMVDREETLRGVHLIQQCLQIRYGRAHQAKVEELRRPKDIRVSCKGRDFAPCQQEQPVEVRLQLPQAVVVGDGVMVRNGNEV